MYENDRDNLGTVSNAGLLIELLFDSKKSKSSVI